jgi:hypothetical protein
VRRDPYQGAFDTNAADRRGMQHRGQQRLRAPRPVRLIRRTRTDAGGVTVARAINSAPSQSPAQVTGDHRSSSTPGTVPAPVGSNCHTRPNRSRHPAVASSTSGLVEVDTTAPACARTAGIITLVVLPDRGGPSRSAARSGRALGPRAAPPTPRTHAEVDAAAKTRDLRKHETERVDRRYRRTVASTG